MSVSPAEAAATLRARAAATAAAASARAERVWALLPAAAALLRSRYAAGDIWLFGSFATGAPHLDSDVDIAVGAPIPELFGAMAALEDLLDCPVDLVVLPSASASLRTRVAATGVPL